MTTLKDIAAKLRVSISTVSRALNGQPGLSPALRTRIAKTAQELRYHPHAAARALRNKATRTIGLVIPDILNPFFPSLVKGVEVAAKALGYHMVLFHAEGGATLEAQLLDFVLEQRVDGLLIAPPGDPIRSAGDLSRERFPIVVLDRRLANLEAPSVTADNYGGGRLATLHLLEQGCWPIYHVSGPVTMSSAAQRLRGFKAALAERGKACRPTLVRPGAFSLESGYRAGEALVPRLEGTPGVFAGNDVMALGILDAFRRNSVRVPQDVQLVGFDGIPLGAISAPRLSTVAQPIAQMGRIGVQKLLQVIQGRRDRVRDVVLPVKLVVRESSGA
jgi:LacI family transcriptional regulator